MLIADRLADPVLDRRESVEAPGDDAVERESPDGGGRESVETGIENPGDGAGESEILEGDPVEREGIA